MKDHTLPAAAEVAPATQRGSARKAARARVVQLIAHPLALLLLAFAANTLLWALVVKPGRAPDEWAHFDYIRHIAIHGALPIYGQTTHVDDPTTLNSEAILPPLYYLLATPVQLALSGYDLPAQMLGLRAFSALLGMLTVALVYALGRALAPRRPNFALACAALVGFNPMFSFISAAINSDTLINMIYAALLLALYHGTRQPQPSRRWLIGLGALLGAGLITKPSILAGGAASGLFLIGLAWQQRGRRPRALLAYAGWAGGAALLVSGWMLARNWLLYGDPTGVLLIGNTPNAYVTHPYSKVGSLWAMLFSQRPFYIAFFPSLLHGFWGVFDFYIIWLPQRVYAALDWLLLGGVAGAALALWQIWHSRPSGGRRLLAFAAICGLIGALVLWQLISAAYRIDYQPQGRYLFPILVPLTIAIVAGWEYLAGLLKLRRVIAPLLVALLLGINMLALFTAVAPNYHDAYLTSLAALPDAPAQYVAGAFAASARFVAERSQIAQLEVLLSRPANASSPIIWRLRQDGQPADAATAVELKPPKGLARYRIGLPQPLRAGAAYTLSVQAPWLAEDKRLAAYMRPEQDGASDLHLQVVYPPQGAAALHRADYLLRSAAPGWPRGNGQRLLFVCAPLLMLALATRAFKPLLGRWSWIGALAALAIVLAIFWAPPQMAGDAIPTRELAAAPGALLTLDQSKASADLILLAGSTAAQKYPPDDPAKRASLVQPYRFGIGGDTRAVLAMQPPSAITYTLRLPARAALHTALALNPDVWQPDKGDGVEFVIQLDAADGRHELLRQYIDPKREPADRRWHDIAIDLSAYAGQDVRLTLRTLPGPAGDGRYDWAGWGEPVIVQGNE